ncbi:MAG TPA: ABC transporter substrate-binding protein [Acidimicrobiales bacterium]
MRFRRSRWSIAVAAALLAVSCGSDRGDAPETAATSAPTSEQAPDTSTSQGEMFGDLPSPCGEGDASGATDVGVTDESITIGYGDDAGYPSSPGLNHEMSDAVSALIEWCNAQGGINGRTIIGKYYDAKILDVNNAMITACNDGVFMLVGQGWVLDASQEEQRVGCELASIPAYSVSPEFAHGPFMRAGVPNPTDMTPLQYAAAFQRLFPDAIKKTALMYGNFAATRDSAEKVRQGFPAFGFEILDCDQEYNLGGEDDWKPFVQRLKDCGAEVVYFAGEAQPNFQNFLNAAAQLQYRPKYLVDANFYEDAFAQWNAQNGGAADNVYVRMAFIPFEEADHSPATQKYIDLITASGGDISLLGAQAADAFLLWATAVKACGSDVTRECVLEQVDAIKDWTGGGLHAPTNPGENRPPECGLLLKLEGGSYVRVDPPQPGTFDCDPSYVQPVTGEVVDRVKLDENRVSTLYVNSR